MESQEIERIKKVYEKRKEKVAPSLYSYFNQGNLFMIQSREREILKFFKRFGITPLEDKRIIAVGC